MRHLIIILAVVALLSLVGCAPPSANPKLVGIYHGTNEETLVFMPDTRVFHTKTLEGKEERFFIGYFSSNSSASNAISFVGPDTSPFVGTSFTVSDDFSTVTARWNNLRQPTNNWEFSYRRELGTN